MIVNIVDAKDPNLRKKSKAIKKIDKKVRELISNMKETLTKQEDPEGVGLAAPQVGKNLRLFIMKPHKEMLVVINPKIVTISKEKTKSDNSLMEGCLSLPHFYSPLERAKKITISFLNEQGDKKQKSFEGYEAQIVQHEIDHLDGIMFVDRVLKQKKPLYEHLGGEWEEVDIIV